MSVYTLSQIKPSKYPKIDDGYNKFTISQSVENGVVTRSGQFKRSSVKDNFGDLESYNFSMANYEALGVVDRLKSAGPRQLQNHDLDTLETSVKSVFNVSQE